MCLCARARTRSWRYAICAPDNSLQVGKLRSAAEHAVSTTSAIVDLVREPTQKAVHELHASHGEAGMLKIHEWREGAQQCLPSAAVVTSHWHALLKTVPCLQVLASEEQQQRWAEEEEQQAKRARERSIFDAHRASAAKRQRTQRRKSTREDVWRRDAAVQQSTLWRRELRRVQASAAALAQHRAAAQARDAIQRLGARRNEGERRASCAVQAMACWQVQQAEAAMLESHGASARVRDVAQQRECERQVDARKAACARQERALVSHREAEHLAATVARAVRQLGAVSEQEGTRKAEAKRQHKAHRAAQRAEAEEAQAARNRLSAGEREQARRAAVGVVERMYQDTDRKSSCRERVYGDV